MVFVCLWKPWETSWLFPKREMKRELIFSESGLWGNSSLWAHSFLLFHGHLKTLAGCWRGGKLFLLPSLFLFTAAEFSELNCRAVSSLFTLPRPTSVVNFPPWTRDDVFLDCISQGRQRNCQSAEPHTEKEVSWTWRSKNSGLGTNLPALGKLATPLCFGNIMKGYF